MSKAATGLDFRDDNKYSENAWQLVWGISGEKPAEILDLTAPVNQPAIHRSDNAGDAKTPVRPGKYNGPNSGGKRKADDIQRSEGAVVFNMEGQTVGTQTNIGKMTGGFVQPGMTVHGNVQQAGRDIVMGDQIKAGRDIHQALNSQFEEVLKRVESLPKEDQPVVRSAVETVRDRVGEIQQSGIEDETSPKYGALKKGLKILVEWAPDISDVVLSFLQNPTTGIVKGVRKVAEKIKAEMK